MGANLCARDNNINREPITYFKTLDQFSHFSESEREKVKLSLILKNIQDTSNYEISLLLYTDKQKLNFRNVASTEIASAVNNEIIFNQFLIMEYYFEREQALGFQIKGSFNETIQTTLGSIMGSRGQKLKKTLSNNSILEISGQRLSDLKTNLNFEVAINGNLNGMGISYLIKYLGTQSHPLNNNIYRSEITSNNSSITFTKSSIPTIALCPDGKFNDNIIQIELYDNYKNNKLGELTSPIQTFISNDQKITNNIINATIKTTISTIYSFLDFLRGGMEINLTIGIDFTGSNGSPSYSNSLHYLAPGSLNNYERAIRSCGDILAVYDADQLFPVYGYGALYNGSQNNMHCFALNGNQNNPDVNTIDNILKLYRQVVPKLSFSGPTYFAPLINNLNNNVKEDLRNGKKMNYNILMILTDGQIGDMRETIDALVEASYLPISVIIVGIGNGPFGNMDILDADDNPLFDRNGRKADRDLVQFVPFDNFKNDGDKLAEQVLEEVPRQVVEYYDHKKISPMDDLGKSNF